MKYVIVAWHAETIGVPAGQTVVRTTTGEVDAYDTIGEAAARAEQLNTKLGSEHLRYETAEETVLHPLIPEQPVEVTAASHLYDPRHHNGPGLRRLRADPRAESTRAAVVADQQRATARAAAEAAVVKEVAPQSAGRSSAEKRAPPKAKRSSPPKKVAKSTPPSDLRLADRVRWIGEGAKRTNPCRPGSGRHERYEAMRARSGATVEEMLGVVPAATLRNASALGIIKMGR
jgi:hypothetical protein